MKILHLTLHKKWFELIAVGLKPIEFREDKPYWQKRLMNPDGSFREFDQIHSRNGYGADKPLIVTKFGGIGLLPSSRCTSQHGELLPTGNIFVIGVGDIIRIENYTVPLHLRIGHQRNNHA